MLVDFVSKTANEDATTIRTELSQHSADEGREIILRGRVEYKRGAGY